MTESFREELRRALAADAAVPDHGLEDRILTEVRGRIEQPARRRGIRRVRVLDLETAGPPRAAVLVAAVLTIVVVAALVLVGALARSRAVPARPAPSAVATPTPADPAVKQYRALVDTGFAPVQQAGDESFRSCGSLRPSVNCRDAAVRAKQAAQAFLDSVTATTPPAGLQDAHAELVGGLRELIPAYDAQLAAIDSGDTSEMQSRNILSYQVKADKVYHGVADTDCWPKRTVQNQEGGLTWRCPR